MSEPAANPYLWLAANIAAGLDGIERNATPPPPIVRRPVRRGGGAAAAVARGGGRRARRERLYRKPFGDALVDYIVMMKRAEVARYAAVGGDRRGAQRLGDARVLRDLLMCRLLAHVARRPMTVAEAIGAADLASFADLSPRHPDGWGMAWWPDAAALRGRSGPPGARGRSAARARIRRSTSPPAGAGAGRARPPARRDAGAHVRGSRTATRSCATARPSRRTARSTRRTGCPSCCRPTSRRRSRARPTASGCSGCSTRGTSRAAGRFPAVVRDTLAEVLQTYTSPVLNAMYLAPDALYVHQRAQPDQRAVRGRPAGHVRDPVPDRGRARGGRVVRASTSRRRAAGGRSTT